MTEEHAADSAIIIEGLPGRIPYTAGGVTFFIAQMILSNVRSWLHPIDVTFSFELAVITEWAIIFLLLLLVVVPLLHQAFHAVAALIAGSSLKLSLAGIYPRVRPAQPVRKRAARWILLAPLLLTLICIGLMLIPPVSTYALLIGSINTAVSVNDIWKALGLARVPASAWLRFYPGYCEVVSAATGAQ